MTSYSDVRSIESDLRRWRDEDADPVEARAALHAMSERVNVYAVAAAVMALDSEFFDVNATGVIWRE